jgi:hypothetical protein
MLVVRETYRELWLAGTDLLSAWLGPAVRGLVARVFKARVCRFSPAEQNAERRYCKGCPVMAGCPYGETLEADPPRDEDAPPGGDDATRALVIAPPYPFDPNRPLELRATFLGTTASAHVAAFWEAVAAAGRLSDRGLGPANLQYEVRPVRPDHFEMVDLPLSPDALAGVVPRLRLEIVTPLNLEERDESDRKRPLRSPTFAQLFRASLRTLATLHRLYATPLPDAGFAALKVAAETVQLVEHDYHPADTRQRSTRSGHAMDVEAIVGRAIFADVPLSLARWLCWGGRVHVGGHRVKGYGGWCLAWSLDPMANLASGPARWQMWES